MGTEASACSSISVCFTGVQDRIVLYCVLLLISYGHALDTIELVVVSNNLLVTLVTQKIVVDRPL